MRINKRSVIRFFLILGVFYLFLLTFPAVINLSDPSMGVTIQYTWTGPNTVQIGPAVQSAIPNGYSLYLYSAEPLDRSKDKGLSLPEEKDWHFTAYTNGWGGKIVQRVNHTELIEAVCVKTGTDTEKGYEHKTMFLDTFYPEKLKIHLDCLPPAP